MELFAISQSLLIGSIAGILYGLSFLLFRGRRVLSFIAAFVRLSIIGLFIFYLLRSPSIHFILVLSSFLMMFWLTILKKKAALDGRI